MNEETYQMPPRAAHVNHGRTPAAWTLSSLVVAGLIVGTIGFAMDRMPILIAGLVIIAGGIVAGLVMRGMGHGQPVEKAAAREWYQD